MIDLTAVATYGLVIMALYGSTGDLHNEHCIGATPACVTSPAVRSQLDRDAAAQGLLITCPNGKKEHIAPAIRLPDGTEVAMVEPIWVNFCYDDHFIIRHPDGRLERWDVGYTERIPAYSRVPPRSMNRSVRAIPRKITDFAKLRNGDDDGGGVGSLIPPPPPPPPPPMTMTVVMPAPMMTMTMAASMTMTVTMATPPPPPAPPMTMTVAMTKTPPPDPDLPDGSNTGGNDGGGETSPKDRLAPAPTPPAPPSERPAPSNTPSAAVGSSRSSSSNAGVVVGGVMVAAGALIYFSTGGVIGDLSFTPDYSFYHSDGGSSYYYGARWDYAKDNTSAYWFTGQSGSGEVLDKWRSGSGASWTNGVWKAAYNGSGDSETLDADMSLSLIQNSGVWTFNTGLGGFATIDEDNNTETNYFLRAQAQAKYQHWTLSNSAYYNGNTGQLNLNFVRNW